MPGVIMENGDKNGVHTNHDRQPWQNGVNGTAPALSLKNPPLDKQEPQQNMTPTSPGVSNGNLGGGVQQMGNGNSSHGATSPKAAQLPPELIHMTMGYIPWASLLTRQTQRTFVGMTTTIQALADMHIPSLRINGYNAQNPNSDDNSAENLNKKVYLLKYLERTHADWAKQLALAQWSRKADDVSRLVDLQTHLREEKWFYDRLIGTLCETKRALLGATLPNPDLRTALEVLSSGTVSWMPELGYIPPAPLTAQEIVEQLDELNIVLSMRLNIHEHENIPFYFSNYTISSGRVTFKVDGEFDVDLAVASDDYSSQFWFIDLRFRFSPQPSNMDPSLRLQVEQTVNDILLKDGLTGCYKYLHELVLTRKILELRKQITELARGRWVEGLKVEQLNRALSFQYWVDRYAKGPKSWVVLGVHSGIAKNGKRHARDTSRLAIRWFRDGKEVTDAEIPINSVELSGEALLNTVIARHINFTLKSIYDQLCTQPVLAAQESSMELVTSSSDPTKTILKINITHSQQINVTIEPITGRFVIGPASPRMAEAENKLNFNSQNPAQDAHNYIVALRTTLLIEENTRYATSVGLQRRPGPNVRGEIFRPLVPRDTQTTAWFSRSGWLSGWYLAVTSGMSGEKWWLFEISEGSDNVKILNHIAIPIKSISPVPSYSFMSMLTVFAAGILTNFANTKTLYRQGALSALKTPNTFQKGLVLPDVYARLSQLLPSKNIVQRTSKAWAHDIIRISFQGLEIVTQATATAKESQVLSEAQTENELAMSFQHAATHTVDQPPKTLSVVVTEAKMTVPLPQTITNVNEQIDCDIAFHAKSGAFAFRLRTQVGETIVPALVERVVQVERLVDYVQVLQSYQPQLQCKSVTLGMINFQYTMQQDISSSSTSSESSESVARNYQAKIDFGNVDRIQLILDKGNPHLRIVDDLNQILNSPQGFAGVAKLLPVTAPALRGLDSLQLRWSKLLAMGECFVMVRAVDWYVFRYMIHRSEEQTGSSGASLSINFSLKLQHRRGEPFWHLQRVDVSDGGSDIFEKALQEVWNAIGKRWLGMRLSAVARPMAIEELLETVDEVVRTVGPELASSLGQADQSAQIPPQGIVPGSDTKTLSKLASPQQPQRPVANTKLPVNNQRPQTNQNQGRGNIQQRDVVVLD